MRRNGAYWCFRTSRSLPSWVFMILLVSESIFENTTRGEFILMPRSCEKQTLDALNCSELPCTAEQIAKALATECLRRGDIDLLNKKGERNETEKEESTINQTR